MNVHSPNQENRRLFDRIEMEGILILDGKTYSIKDISVGGLQIEQKLEGAKKGSLIDGKVGLNQSSIRL
jgi:hypothetical protein